VTPRIRASAWAWDQSTSASPSGATACGCARAETFAGMLGAIFGFAPNEMITAEWMSKRSGEETILGLSAGKAEAGDASGPRVNYHQQIRRVCPAHDLLNLPEGHGVVCFAGQARPLPVHAPKVERAASSRMARLSAQGHGWRWPSVPR
jgi:hypothetical protein